MKSRSLFLSKVRLLVAAGVAFTLFGNLDLRADWANGRGSWKFAVFGDHRGDNKAFQRAVDSEGKTVTVGYTDGGINKPALASLAAAVKAENVDFAVNVGDLVTKWQPEINAKDADTLITEELQDWRAIWLENAGNLPIFPVRGNQEYSAPISTWLNWLQTMPGIGEIQHISVPPNDVGFSYAFTCRNCLFVAVDEYSSAISADSPTLDPQTLDWLSSLFSSVERPHVFVYGHAPAYEVWDSKKNPFKVTKDGLPSPAPVDAQGVPLTPVLSRQAIEQVRDPLWNLLGSRAATYFCGHDHIYARGVAQDAEGQWVTQVIIGNGGAPPPNPWAAAYGADPFVESVLGQLPASPRYINNWGSPRIHCEAFEQPGKLGYVVVEIQGSHAKATYKAQDPAGGPFMPVESWDWKITGQLVE